MRSVLLAAVVSTAAAANAGQAVDLATAQRLAEKADPRVAQLQLEAEQTELRLRTISMERRPALALEGQAQYQSDVVELPIALQNGANTPKLSHDTYDGHLGVEQSLYDPGRRARIAEEQARLAEAQARTRTALYALRRDVDEAFFTAALMQEREAQVATVISDLEARLREAQSRVAQDVALPGEAASIEAALLQRREDSDALRAGRRAALARLAALTGRDLAPDDSLVLPSLEAPLAQARASAPSLRKRPEFAQFARMRDRLDAQRDLARANQWPQVSAYGRAGYGKPGLNFLGDRFQSYWLAGIRVQWKPWNWGKTQRDREILELEKQAIRADEEAFSRALGRSIDSDLAEVDRLAATASTDERIVALRELIERETRARYDEHVVTAADYVDKQTDVLEARLLRTTHRVLLAQAQARVLNLLGVEIP